MQCKICNFFVPNFVRITDSKVDNLFYRLTRFTFDHEYIHSKVKSNIISAKIENQSIYIRDALTVSNGPVRDKEFLVNFWLKKFLIRIFVAQEQGPDFFTPKTLDTTDLARKKRTNVLIRTGPD